MVDFMVNWLASTVAAAPPYALAALGLIIAERTGVLSLTAEGLMLIGAMSGVAAFMSLGAGPGVALVAAMASASLVSVLFALLVVVLRVNQVIAGLAIVFFCQGLSNLLGDLGGWTNHAIAGLAPMPLPLLADLPVLGRIFFRQDAIVYLTVPIVLGVQYLLTQTMVGLRLRAVGHNPEAADAAGVSVARYRFLAVVGGSALIGLAGADLSVANSKIWIDDMTGGRGWIAVALVIFARWRPWRALAGALLFGGVEALVPRIAAIDVKVPQYFMLMTPYLATGAVMIWTAIKKLGETEAPRALGIAHLREERR